MFAHVCCLLCNVRCVLFVVRGLLRCLWLVAVVVKCSFVARCLMRVVCCLLFVVCCLLIVGWRVLPVVCCVCCVVFCICCLLFGVP